MLCDPVSHYPDKIDEMAFFQDNDLEKTEIINTYNNLVTQGRYSEAASYINHQDGAYGFFADFFNLIENRIYNLQKHLLETPKKQPFLYHDEEEHFAIRYLHVFTDTDEEEDLSSILLFSYSDKQESIENLYTFTGEEVEPPNADEDTIWI